MKYSAIPIEERLKILKGVLIFNSLDRDIFENLAQNMGEIIYQPGQLVVAEGELANRLFVIVDGQAEVSVRSIDEKTILATIRKGDFFGEMAFLAEDHQRKATVTAISELHLLFLDKTYFDNLTIKFPRLLNSIKEIRDMRMKVNFLKQFSPFQSLAPDKITMPLSNLEKISVGSGTTVIQQGMTGQECYLIISGRMEVIIQEGECKRKIATLYPGSILGEAAILTDEPRNATVRSIEQCELLVIKRDILLQIMREDMQIDTFLMALLQQRDRPRRIEDVEVQEQKTTEGDTLRIMKNTQSGNYIRLSTEGWFIWQRLDGHHTLKDLTLDFMNEWKTLAPEKISTIISELLKAGFIRSKTLRPDVLHIVSNTSWTQRIRNMASSVMEFYLVWKNPDPFFSLLYRFFGKFLFSKILQILLILFSISGLVLFFTLGSHVSSFLHDSSQSWPVLIFLIPALFGSLLIHEIGHAITTKHFNRKLRAAGIGWYWFGPVAFVDTTDMWTTGKWQRITVSVAGPYAVFILAGIASYIAWFSSSLIISASLWQFALVSYINVLMNFDPLLEYDGYYIVSDLLDRPNLRRHSLEWLGRYLRDDIRGQSILQHHWFEFLYGISSIVYAVFMAYTLVISYRIILQSTLELFLPLVIASVLPWFIATIIIFSAGITIIGEMKIFQHSAR